MAYYQTPGNEGMDLIFMGTGGSSGIPLVGCVTDPAQTCGVCCSSTKPDGAKNKRRNTGAVVRIDGKTLVIDAGKSFYTAALDIFPRYGLRRIDALILTHAHADAMFGLDDLRAWTLGGLVQKHMDVYLDPHTMHEVTRTFPYMVHGPTTGGGEVPQFTFHVFDPNEDFTAAGVPVRPLPVEHGLDFKTKTPYMSNGFQVGGLAYISDASAIPPEVMQRIEGCAVLVLDSLNLIEHYSSHISVAEAKEVVRALRPGRTLLVGFSHRTDHYVTEEELAAWSSEHGVSIEPAFDGQYVHIP